MISANILTLLTAQYAHEISNALSYTLMQSWADMRGLNGTAAFFRKQAADEQAHAAKVLDYIHARSEQLSNVPAITPIQVAGLVFDTFVGQFDAALALEVDTTAAIARVYAQAMAESDMMTCAWLAQPGGLILEQVEEENVIQTIIDRIIARAAYSTAGADLNGDVVHDIDCWLKGLE